MPAFDAENFLDVIDAHHFARCHAFRAVAGQQQVFLDLRLVLLRALRLAGEQSENAVGVAHGRDFRIHDHDGAIGEVHCEVGPLLDAGGRIAQNEIEAVGDEFVEHATHAFERQRILVACLRSCEHEQRVDAFVFDQRLFQRRFALDDVDEVVHHAALAAHDQVEVAQADVEVDDGDFLAALGQAAGNAGRSCRFADTALARGNNDDLSQCFILR